MPDQLAVASDHMRMFFYNFVAAYWSTMILSQLKVCYVQTVCTILSSLILLLPLLSHLLTIHIHMSCQFISIIIKHIIMMFFAQLKLVTSSSSMTFLFAIVPCRPGVCKYEKGRHITREAKMSMSFEIDQTVRYKSAVDWLDHRICWLRKPIWNWVGLPCSVTWTCYLEACVTPCCDSAWIVV